MERANSLRAYIIQIAREDGIAEFDGTRDAQVAKRVAWTYGGIFALIAISLFLLLRIAAAVLAPS